MSRNVIALFIILSFAIVAVACSGPIASTSSKIDPREVFSPLGEMVIPEDNPMTPEKIELGKLLYFDPRLSGDDTLSCASCHAPEKGWSDKRRTFLGFQGNVGARNSPSIINSGYYSLQFWDGRMKTLEEQALGPIQDKGEMNSNLEKLLVELSDIPEYVERFDQVFNSEITSENLAKAIAAFERTIVINDTAFDKYLAGDENALSAQAKAGMDLFVGKANCVQCHNGASLTDNNFHNVGMDSEDLGRAKFTLNPEDTGKVKTPALRGIGQTMPYMHNGKLATLHEVVEFFDRGGDKHEMQSVLIQPLSLSNKEKANLVAFLESLTGDELIIEVPDLP